MTKHFRFAVLFVLMALVLALVPATFAQDDTFGLSADDFALFSNANGNSAAASSLAYDFNLVLVVSGIEDADINADISGSGVIGMGASPLFSMTTTGSANLAGEVSATDLEVRVVDGMVFFNPGGEGWQGSSIEDLTEQGSSVLPIDPAALMEGDMSALEDMSGMGDIGGIMGDLSSMDASAYVSMERLDDMDGMAHFVTSLDIAGLLSSEELSGLLGMAMGGVMGGSSDMTPEQAAQMGSMFGMMFADATFTLEQYVNVETEMIGRSVLSINFPLESLLGTPGAAVEVTFDISLSSFNEPVTVEAPADFEPISMGS